MRTVGSLAAARLPATGLAAMAAGAAAMLAWRYGFYANTVLAAVLGCLAIVSLALGNSMVSPNASVEPDDTELAKAQARAIASRVLLDHVPTPLLFRSRAGILHARNRAARRLFRTDDRVTQSLDVLDTARKSLEVGECAVVRMRRPGETGPPRSYAVVSAQLDGEAGSGTLLALTDIESELQAAEATILRDILAVLSHEIMNSLTPIASLAGTVRALLTDPAPDGLPAAIDAMETIERRTAALNRFVFGYRQLSRLPPPDVRSCRIAFILEEARRLFDDRNGTITLVVEGFASEQIVRLDPDLTIQALLNLLTNGADAAMNAAQWVSLTGSVLHGRAVFTVEDGGLGVDADHADSIFRPFFTLKPQGSGIGLMMARQIAQTQGGSLTLDSPVAGKGARFRMSL